VSLENHGIAILKTLAKLLEEIGVELIVQTIVRPVPNLNHGIAIQNLNAVAQAVNGAQITAQTNAPLVQQVNLGIVNQNQNALLKKEIGVVVGALQVNVLHATPPTYGIVTMKYLAHRQEEIGVYLPIQATSVAPK
jgi:hypothetical protein